MRKNDDVEIIVNDQGYRTTESTFIDDKRLLHVLSGAYDAWLRGRQRLDGSTALKRQPGDGAGFAGAGLDVGAFSAATDGNRKCC